MQLDLPALHGVQIKHPYNQVCVLVIGIFNWSCGAVLCPNRGNTRISPLNIVVAERLGRPLYMPLCILRPYMRGESYSGACALQPAVPWLHPLHGGGNKH